MAKFIMKETRRVPKDSIATTTIEEGIERDNITTFKTISVPSKISINQL
ncbi:MAG: hypothetical protein KatS3mg096_116 [Candidatus Parcubacteria bacterium]|nr:MAG: hypothetical protein KatS3mg096_116 [Candidatus Parcubacteria bacterium]